MKKLGRLILQYKIDFYVRLFFLFFIYSIYCVLIMNTISILFFLYRSFYRLHLNFFLKYLPTKNIHIRYDNE